MTNKKLEQQTQVLVVDKKTNKSSMVAFEKEFSKVKINHLSSMELNYFFILIKAIEDKQDNDIVIHFDYFKSIMEEYANQKEKINSVVDNLRAINRKILSNVIIAENKRYIDFFNMFQYFRIDKEEKIIKAKVNLTFLHFFNEIRENYNSIELKHLLTMKSKYSKFLYAKLWGLRDFKKLKMDVDSFYFVLDIPPQNQNSDYLKKKILFHIEKELSNVFSNFKIVLELEKPNKKISKSNKYKNIKFSWSGVTKEQISLKEIFSDEQKEESNNFINWDD